MKLKLNTQASTADSRRPSSTLNTAEAVQTPGGGIKLNLSKLSKPSTPATPSTAEPLSSTKKRPADPTIATTAPAPKKPKTILKLKSQSTPTSADPARKPSIIRLKRTDTAATNSPATPGGTVRPSLKVKYRGKLPARPLGVGYDSECDDAEPDPAIEENIILRMQPGPDAEYLRKAIEERKLGVPLREGGADVNLRFFQKDARRACVRVQDRFYSAVLVDLPCITETMKSWDKKGWWKAADICQMLLVTGRVASEDKARDAPLPREMDKETWAWPHGLTPPMYDVRRRRFRKKTNYRSVEQLEAEVERLLEEDEKAMVRGGGSVAQVMTWQELKREEEGPPSEEEEEEELFDDEEEMVETMEVDDAEGEEEDPDAEDDFVAGLTAAFGDDSGSQPASSAPQTPGAQPDGTSKPAVVEASDAQLANLQDGEKVQVEIVPETQADDSEVVEAEVEDRAGEASASASDDDDDEDASDDEDEASDEELSEEAREKRERIAQAKEEVAHLERQIAEKKLQLGNTQNPLLRSRLLNTIKKFEEDRDVKKRGLGLPTGDEEDDGDDE